MAEIATIRNIFRRSSGIHPMKVKTKPDYSTDKLVKHAPANYKKEFDEAYESDFVKIEGNIVRKIQREIIHDINLGSRARIEIELALDELAEKLKDKYCKMRKRGIDEDIAYKNVTRNLMDLVNGKVKISAHPIFPILQFYERFELSHKEHKYLSMPKKGRSKWQ
jgi:hypothetical protein